MKVSVFVFFMIIFYSCGSDTEPAGETRVGQRLSINADEEFKPHEIEVLNNLCSALRFKLGRDIISEYRGKTAHYYMREKSCSEDQSRSYRVNVTLKSQDEYDPDSDTSSETHRYVTIDSAGDKTFFETYYTSQEEPFRRLCNLLNRDRFERFIELSEGHKLAAYIKNSASSLACQGSVNQFCIDFRILSPEEEDQYLVVQEEHFVVYDGNGSKEFLRGEILSHNLYQRCSESEGEEEQSELSASLYYYR